MALAMLVFSLFDRKAGDYGGLVLSKNEEMAKRTLLEAMLKSESLLSKYPDDYDLMLLGEFDDETGELSGSFPRRVCSLREVLDGTARAFSVVEDSRGSVDSVKREG